MKKKNMIILRDDWWRTFIFELSRRFNGGVVEEVFEFGGFGGHENLDRKSIII